MKRRLMEALSVENRMISENTNDTNKNLVISLLTILRTVDTMYNGSRATLIYLGDNPLTFLLLFIASYLFGYKLIKVLGEGELQDKVLLAENPIVFVDKLNYSEDIAGMIRYKPFVVFLTHNLKCVVKATTSNYIATFDYVKNSQQELEGKNHGMLIGILKSYIEPGFVRDMIVVELPSSGIHSPEKSIGFSKENIDSIVGLISRLPHLVKHDVVRIFSSIESSFFYMLSVYVNQKTLLFNVTNRNTLAIELYSKRQATVLDSSNMMYLWNVLLKEYVSSNGYRVFNRPLLRWIIGLKLRTLLRQFFGHSLKSLYIINAGIPNELKQLLRSSFLEVVFLYGIRETGNIIGSNFKKDKIPLYSYKIENHGDDINVAEDDVTGVLFVKGEAVADTLRREYISNSTKEEDLYVNTQDVGSVNGDFLTFLTPIGTAISKGDRLNFDLYFAERSLLLLPEVLHTVSFEYQNNWYIGVQVDESYLDRTNINIDSVEFRLEGIRQKMNIHLPVSNAIRGIKITTNDLLLNTEGVPVRFLHKMGDAHV